MALSNVLMNALTGAGTGAGLGASLGGVGALPGAIGGGLLGGLSGLMGGGSNQQPQPRVQNLQQTGSGVPAGYQKFSQFEPNQVGAMNQLLQQGLQGVQQPLGSGFGPIAQQARQRFERQTMPTIAERFTGMNGQRSSAFNRFGAQAGADLEGDLASRQAQFGLQDRGQLLQMLQMGLSPQFGFVEEERNPFMMGLAGAAPQGISSLLSLLPMLLQGRQQQQPQFSGSSVNRATTQSGLGNNFGFNNPYMPLAQ